LQVAQDVGKPAHGGGHHGREEDEGGKLARGDGAGQDVAAAHPEHGDDGAEDQRDDHGGQHRPGPGPGGGGLEGGMAGGGELRGLAVSWAKAWTVRTAFTVSSAWPLTSAIRSWALRDSRRTMRPKTTIGTTTRGTTRSTRPVSLGLVTTRSAVPPRVRRMLRSACVTVEPMTVCTTVVSVVSRESTSPVRVVSKKPGGMRMMWP
jgi:hypothetical protein